MKRSTIGISMCAGLLIAGLAHAQATIGGEWREDVRRFAGQVVDAGLAPGLGVAVSKGEWPLYAEGFGLADAGTGRRASADTAFYIASSSKALLASAVVVMAERGEIDLAEPVSRYLPELEFRPPLDADSVTIRQLLTMTHGIDGCDAVVVRTAYTGQFTANLLLELLEDCVPAEGGTAFRYTNLGYNILGLVLDPEDGHGWKDVVRREVMVPLGMASSSARLSTLAADMIAQPHEMTPEGDWQRIRLAKSDANLHAAGGHFATPRDLIRFVAAHSGDGRVEGRRVFPAAAIASTHEAHAEQARTFGPFQRFGWGYGWDLGQWEERTIVHRFGSFPGYRSHMSFDLESRVGVVVLTNGGGIASPAADLVATYIYDRLLGRENLEETYAGLLGDLQSDMKTRTNEEAEDLAKRAARLQPLRRPLEDFAGTYENLKFGRMTWLVVAGGLETRFGVAGSRAEVFSAADDQFRIDLGGGAVASFEFLEACGPATALVVDGIRFQRIDD